MIAMQTLLRPSSTCGLLSFFPLTFGLAGMAFVPVVSAAPPSSEGANARVTFTDSVRELPATQKSTVHGMAAGHLADSIGFNIPLALRNQAELEARVNRGEVLSGAELREKYFPLQADYHAVADYLKGEGFTVDAIGDTNLAVFAHGTVAQVQRSFQTTMGLVTAKGTDYAVAQTAPSLPAAIAGKVLGFSGLSYRRPRSRIAHLAPDSIADPNAVPSAGYKINDIARVYGGYGLAVNGTALTGAGQTIAVESYTTFGLSDYSTFWSNCGVTRTGSLTLINSGTTTLNTPAQDAGDAEEAALDIEWAGGIAPGANLNVYATTYDDNDSPERNYNKAISDGTATGNPIRQFSSSYGPTEAELTTTELTAYNQIFLSMTAEGMTYINATGDVGSSPVEAYGVFPYVLGVGGTALNMTTTTSGIRSTETGWSGSSGGKSTKFAKPAWQVGTGIGTGSATGTMRLFPDIALAASSSTPAYVIFNGSAEKVGGTSWSAPTFAGFLALIHQGRALNTPARGPVGFLNPRLYPLIGTANFFDVTSGSNGGYSATTAYDLVTGIGVPTVSNLLATLRGPTITGFSPTGGPAGTSVVITGTNFYTGPTVPLTVKFNGTAASSVTVNSATQITAVVPSGVTSGLIVVSSFGDTATSLVSFFAGLPDLTVTCTHTGNFTTYDTGDAYTITVTNSGNGTTSGTVSVVDTLQAGLTATGLSGTGWTIGADKLSATRTDALAAGSSYPPLTLTVNVTANMGSVTNSVNVSGGGETNTSNNGTQDVTTISAPSPSQSWRYQYFGTSANTGNGADTANPSGDGIPNLLKYALGLNPLVPTVNPETVDTITGYLRLTVPKNPNATDISYTVQLTSDLTDPAGWTPSGTFIMQNTSTLLQVRDTTLVSGAARRFIRLQVTRLSSPP